VQEANAASQILSRESVEFATQETVNTIPRITDEVEDEVLLVYTGGGGAPSFASAAFVITAMTWNFGANTDAAKVDLRAYTPWQ
jgi:hypothetical protein